MEPYKEHYSHNVSDSFWRCYGCGVQVGDPRLEQPCPTPDEVGKSSIRWHEKQRLQKLSE